jgi:hypothetical protein
MTRVEFSRYYMSLSLFIGDLSRIVRDCEA